MEFLDGSVIDFSEGILQPEERVDVMFFANRHEGIDDGSTLRGVVGFAEKVVFSSQSYRADAVFHCIVVDVELSVVEVGQERFVAFQGVTDGFSDLAFGQRLHVLLCRPSEESIENRQ